ncbi:MAG: hypothetical protein FWF77_00440 [Defluviitaleaceae bacterium]|nr:hypothetical protein [Defluviitaleaceae bacterium]
MSEQDFKKMADDYIREKGEEAQPLFDTGEANKANKANEANVSRAAEKLSPEAERALEAVDARVRREIAQIARADAAKKRRRVFAMWGSLAACFAVGVVVAAYVLNNPFERHAALEDYAQILGVQELFDEQGEPLGRYISSVPSNEMPVADAADIARERAIEDVSIGAIAEDLIAEDLIEEEAEIEADDGIAQFFGGDDVTARGGLAGDAEIVEYGGVYWVSDADGAPEPEEFPRESLQELIEVADEAADSDDAPESYGDFAFDGEIAVAAEAPPAPQAPPMPAPENPGHAVAGGAPQAPGAGFDDALFYGAPSENIGVTAANVRVWFVDRECGFPAYPAYRFMDLEGVGNYREFLAKEGGIRILFTTETTVPDFQFLHVTPDIDRENARRYIIGSTLLSVSELTPDAPILLRWGNYGCFAASHAFSFTDETGGTRTFALQFCNMSGFLMVSEI